MVAEKYIRFVKGPKKEGAAVSANERDIEIFKAIGRDSGEFMGPPDPHLTPEKVQPLGAVSRLSVSEAQRTGGLFGTSANVGMHVQKDQLTTLKSMDKRIAVIEAKVVATQTEVAE